MEVTQEKKKKLKEGKTVFEKVIKIWYVESAALIWQSGVGTTCS